MELVDGGCLTDVIDASQFSEPQMACICKAVLEALIMLHDKVSLISFFFLSSVTCVLDCSSPQIWTRASYLRTWFIETSRVITSFLLLTVPWSWPISDTVPSWHRRNRLAWVLSEPRTGYAGMYHVYIIVAVHLLALIFAIRFDPKDGAGTRERQAIRSLRRRVVSWRGGNRNGRGWGSG